MRDQAGFVVGRTSDDYIYNLALPHLGLKEIAVPDLSFAIEFTADETGTFDLLGDQMCGYDHPELLGKISVDSHAGFNAWLYDIRKSGG